MDPATDATGQSAAVRAGDVSPAELTEAAIHRIEAINPTLNAVIVERFERARAEAGRDLPDGPFRGVPILLKDLHCRAEGDPYHEGTAVLRADPPVADHDSAFVARLRAAGFVVVGRTNTPELGTTITTEPVAWGPTRNPWDTGRSTGGSSGGSAAAVASGMVAVAHASDGGGSIRVPASECGLVGLKPGRARITSAPDAGEGWMGATTNGALTRTVRDTAALVDVMAGPGVGDPYPAIPLPGPLAAEVGADPGRLRIGLVDHPLSPGVTADPQAAAAVAVAGRLLEGLGHQVDVGHPAALEETPFTDHFLRVVAVHTAAAVVELGHLVGRELAEDEIEPLNQLFAGLGRSVTGPDYAATVNWLHTWTRRVVGWWADGWDLLVSPVLNGIPPRIGELTDSETGGSRVAELLQYTSQFNVTGQPALSLPLHVSAEGLPVGVQFVAAPGREDLLVRLAAQLEEAAPWADRRPTVWAS